MSTREAGGKSISRAKQDRRHFVRNKWYVFDAVNDIPFIALCNTYRKSNKKAHNTRNIVMHALFLNT